MHTALILFIGAVHVLAHPSIDWAISAQRTCPHTSDMEQRLARFADLIYLVSMDIPLGVYDFERDYYGVIADYIFDHECAVTFPHTIEDSQAWFSIGAFMSNTLDVGMDGHTAWYSLDSFLDGEGLGDPQPEGVYCFMTCKYESFV